MFKLRLALTSIQWKLKTVENLTVCLRLANFSLVFLCRLYPTLTLTPCISYIRVSQSMSAIWTTGESWVGPFCLSLGVFGYFGKGCQPSNSAGWNDLPDASGGLLLWRPHSFMEEWGVAHSPSTALESMEDVGFKVPLQYVSNGDKTQGKNNRIWLLEFFLEGREEKLYYGSMVQRELAWYGNRLNMRNNGERSIKDARL